VAFVPFLIGHYALSHTQIKSAKLNWIAHYAAAAAADEAEAAADEADADTDTDAYDADDCAAADTDACAADAADDTNPSAAADSDAYSAADTDAYSAADTDAYSAADTDGYAADTDAYVVAADASRDEPWWLAPNNEGTCTFSTSEFPRNYFNSFSMKMTVGDITQKRNFLVYAAI